MIFLEQNKPIGKKWLNLGKCCLIDKSCPVTKLNWMVTHLLKKNKETKMISVTLICTNMVAHTLYNISLFL